MSTFIDFFVYCLGYFELSLFAALFFTLALELFYAFFVGKIRGRGLIAVACCSLVTWPLATSFFRFISGVYGGNGALVLFFVLTEFLVILAEWGMLCLVFPRELVRMFKLSAGMNSLSALFFPVCAMIYVTLKSFTGVL